MPTHIGHPFSTSPFDDFLFAYIADEESGQNLTVVSALARLDIDPWVEAARLAELPRESAIEELAAIIAGPSANSLQLLDPRSVAARLVLYLPKRRAGPGDSQPHGVAGDREPRRGIAGFWHWLLIWITVVVVVYGLMGD